MKKKIEMYTSPMIEIIDVVAEGVLCSVGSGFAGDSDDVELFEIGD